MLARSAVSRACLPAITFGVLIWLCFRSAILAADPLGISLPPGVDAKAPEIMDLINQLDQVGGPFRAQVAQTPATYLSQLSEEDPAIVLSESHILGALAKRDEYSVLGAADLVSSFVVAVRKDDTDHFQLSDLAGKTLCASAVPSLYTLHLLFTIDNPAREPIIVPADDHYRKSRLLSSGRCDAAIFDLLAYLDPENLDTQHASRVIFQSRTMPLYAYGVSNRLPEETANALHKKLSEDLVKSALKNTLQLISGTPINLVDADQRRLHSLAAIMENWLP